MIKNGEPNEGIFIVAENDTSEIKRRANSAFAFTFHDAQNSTSADTKIEQNKFSGPVSTLLRFVTQRYVEVLYKIGYIRGKTLGINSSSLKQIPINNQREGNRGVIKVHLLLK